MVNLRPAEQSPETYYVAVDQDRVIRVLRRIAHDLEELARARRVEDLSTSVNDADPCLRLRRRLAERPIELSRQAASILQARQAWEITNTASRGLDSHPAKSLPASRLFSEVNVLSGFAVPLLPKPPYLIGVPITSPETTSSTRRLRWRPAAVPLLATDIVLPKPLAVTLSALRPCWTR